MQDWQHSAMYAAFMVSGAVDMIGFYSPGLLPAGSEHVSFIGMCACCIALIASSMQLTIHWCMPIS